VIIGSAYFFFRIQSLSG